MTVGSFIPYMSCFTSVCCLNTNFVWKLVN